MRDRKTIGYIRSFRNSQASYDTQKRFIDAYCYDNGIEPDEYFSDMGYRKKRRVSEFARAEKIGLAAKKWTHVFEAWERLMEKIMDGEIGCILVDTKLRLYDGDKQKEVLENLCVKYDVAIIEVGDYQPAGSKALAQLAFYHYSIEPDRRTSVVLNDLDALYEFASQRFARWEVTALYFDLNSSGRLQFAKMMEEADCDLIVVKSFFHIGRKTNLFLKAIKALNERNIRIVSFEEGFLNFNQDKEEKWLGQPLKAAVYDWPSGWYEERFNQNPTRRFKAFMDYCTDGWSMKGEFIATPSKEEQQEKLNDLIERARSEEYDIVFIDSFAKMETTVTGLIRILRQLKLPVISLKEGGLELNEKW